MQKFTVAFFSLVSALGCAGCAAGPENFNALATTEPSNFQRVEIGGSFKGCFQKIYVPAVFQVKTEGVLIARERKHYEVIKDGNSTKWNLVRVPAVYMEKKVLVSPDHYSLHEVDCDKGPLR